VVSQVEDCGVRSSAAIIEAGAARLVAEEAQLLSESVLVLSFDRPACFDLSFEK
jgi:hypothetical protein